MAKTARNFMTGLAATVTLFTAGRAPAAQDEQMALVIHVDNYARVPPSDLERAETVTTSIYAAAGISVTWVHGETDFTLPSDGARHLRVLLLGSEMTNRKVSLGHVPDNVLGQAAHGSTRAHIFALRVRDVALRNHQMFYAALGRVMAHEVGHLLLPANCHSSTGIMRESLDARSLPATFTVAQSRDIQMALGR
jgi:hypothetical protein